MARPKKNGAVPRKRGRPAKVAVAKDDQVEVRTGELELKKIEIDDRSFDMHYKGIKTAKEKMEQYQSAYRSSLNAAKKVSVDLWTGVKRALKFETMDAADIKRLLEIDGYVLKRQASPIQINIFDTLAGDPNDVARKRGWRDGKDGKDSANPFPGGSDLAANYDLGWESGQRSIIGVAQGAVAEGVAEQSNSGEPLPLPA